MVVVVVNWLQRERLSFLVISLLFEWKRQTAIIAMYCFEIETGDVSTDSFHHELEHTTNGESGTRY